MPEADKPTIALAELALDEGSRRYRHVTHYTTELFVTDRPWPVEIDLARLTERPAALMRAEGE